MPARGEYAVEVSTYCGTSRPRPRVPLPGPTRAGGCLVSETGPACEMVGLRLSAAILRSVFQGPGELLSDLDGGGMCRRSFRGETEGTALSRK